MPETQTDELRAEVAELREEIRLLRASQPQVSYYPTAGAAGAALPMTFGWQPNTCIAPLTYWNGSHVQPWNNTV